MSAFNYVFKGKAPPDVDPTDAEESMEEQAPKKEEEGRGRRSWVSS